MESRFTPISHVALDQPGFFAPAEMPDLLGADAPERRFEPDARRSSDPTYRLVRAWRSRESGCPALRCLPQRWGAT
jgi:hypothetical protein